MARQVRWFKALLWCNILLTVAGGIADAFLSPSEEETDLSFQEALFMLLMLVAIVVNFIGLFRLKPWSRPMALWLSGLAMLYACFLGDVLPGHRLPLVLDELACMAWGAVLAMMYFSDIRVHFEGPTQQHPDTLA